MKVKSINNYIVVKDIKEEKAGNLYLPGNSSPTVIKSRIVDISDDIKDITGLDNYQTVLRPHDSGYEYQDYVLVNYEDIIGVVDYE